METKIKPGTPLPWDTDDGDGSVMGLFDADGNGIAYLAEPGKPCIPLPPDESFGKAFKQRDAGEYTRYHEHRKNAAYMKHAANAYPLLVEALKKVATDAEYGSVRDGLFKDIHNDTTTLLRSLGELP